MQSLPVVNESRARLGAVKATDRESQGTEPWSRPEKNGAAYERQPPPTRAEPAHISTTAGGMSGRAGSPVANMVTVGSEPPAAREGSPPCGRHLGSVGFEARRPLIVRAARACGPSYTAALEIVASSATPYARGPAPGPVEGVSNAREVQ